MQNTRSAPGFKSNYRPGIACFRIPKPLPEHKQTWIRLHRKHIDVLKDIAFVSNTLEKIILNTPTRCKRVTIQSEKSLEQVRS